MAKVILHSMLRALKRYCTRASRSCNNTVDNARAITLLLVINVRDLC
jgi:hypothetical protein